MARTNPSPGSRFWIGQAKLVAREAQQVVNQVMLTMGLEKSQQMATVFDGITRHNPEGLWFRRYAQAEGFKAAVQWRDSGRPIPEGDDARERIRALEARGAQSPE